MLSVNNYIFTERGILSITDLLNIQTAGTNFPKVMTFDTLSTSPSYLQYTFTDIDEIEEIEDQNIYEVRFVDVFSNRNIIVNCTHDSEIFQYNVLNTENNSIINKNFQIVSYLNSNLSRTKLSPKWQVLSGLTNYSNKSPNICLGDVLIKYSNKYFRYKESAYNIKYSGSNIPTFTSLTKSTNFNFVLIK